MNSSNNVNCIKWTSHYKKINMLVLWRCFRQWTLKFQILEQLPVVKYTQKMSLDSINHGINTVSPRETLSLRRIRKVLKPYIFRTSPPVSSFKTMRFRWPHSLLLCVYGGPILVKTCAVSKKSGFVWVNVSLNLTWDRQLYSKKLTNAIR